MDWQKCTLNTPRARNDTMLATLEKKLADDKAYKETLVKEAKCSQTHLANRIGEEVNEVNFVDRLQNIREDFHKRKLEILEKQEHMLAMEEETRLQQLEEKRRLQLLQNSEEFREFERHLQRARVAKQQALQIMGKESQIKALQEAEAEQRHRLKSESELHSIIQERQKYMRDMRQKHYQSILWEQMEKRREQDDEDAWQENERGRRETDEIIRELQAERKQALEKRNEKRKEIQQSFEDSWRLRDHLRDKEKIRQEMDTHRIQEYIKERETREKFWQESQNHHLRQISELKEKLGNLILEERYKREESENERMRLQQLRLQQEQQKQDQMALAMEQRRRFVARDSMAYQYRLREAQLFREMAEEEKYRQTEISNLAKCGGLDKERRQIQRAKQMEHLRQLRNMMDEVKTRSGDEKLTNELFVKRVEEDQKMNNMAIQVEKLKLLKNEMSELWGHLPKCVLRSAGRFRNNCLAPI